VLAGALDDDVVRLSLRMLPIDSEQAARHTGSTPYGPHVQVSSRRRRWLRAPIGQRRQT
jgi:hypothetical protein